MDTNSPEKSTGGFNNEYEFIQSDKTDLNAYENKEGFGVGNSNYENEVSCVERKVYSNMGYTSPSMPLCEVEGGQPASVESYSVCSLHVTTPEEATGAIKPKHGISGVSIEPSDCGIEGKENLIKDHQKDKVLEADINTGATAYNFTKTEGLNYHLNDPLDQGNNEPIDSMDRECNEKHNEKTSAADEVVNSDITNLPVNSQPDEVEVNDEMNYETLSMKSSHKMQVSEVCYSLDTVPPENVGMVWEQSSLQSPQENQNVSHSPERRLSVSAERSSHKQSPPKSPTFPNHEIQSPAKFDSKQVPSPRSSRRRYSPSPEKNSSGRERISRDRSSPSTRRKSPDRASKREDHYRVDSPKRHAPRSPQKQDSPGIVRSASKSPTRRRHSPRNRRDHRRSRSRSPIARDHNRRSPSKRSSRRRSPPIYHSGRRSPRRQWSPPSNRNTGIGKPGRNLYVAGFSYGTTEKDLERKFSKFGRVTDVRVVRERRSGDSRGFGFLSLERDEEADDAIRAVDQSEWNGRIILVEKSKSSSRRS